MPRTPRDITTELLVLGAQDGDRDSFQRLFLLHNPPLSAYALRCAGSPDLAAEAVQDAWVHIFAGIRKLRDPAAFRTWSYRIVTRRCADRLRTASRERIQTARHHSPTRSQPHPQTDAVSAAIEALPPDLALTLRLYYADGFGTHHIARILDIEQNTVKSRLAAARRRVAEALEPAPQGDPRVHTRR